MSIDVAAGIRHRFAAGDLLAVSAGVLAQLLGEGPLPALSMVVEQRYEQGRKAGQGRRLSGTELDAEVPDGFEVHLDGLADRAWCRVIDDDPEYPDEDGFPARVLCSPSRTCAGIVVTTAVALAAARCGGGAFHDDEIRMLATPVHHPQTAIEAMRLPGPYADFAARCEAFLRQFPHLNGWPLDRTI